MATCKCNQELPEEVEGIYLCRCGRYYRPTRGFGKRRWTFAGWYKGSVSEREINRQRERRRRMRDEG